MLERNKYKFSPLGLPEELPALFHGETLPFACSTTTSLSDHTYHEIQSVPATAKTQLRSAIFDSEICDLSFFLLISP